jgi:ADP-ribose pyrophosphatase
MVRQFRSAAGRILLEIPAGTLERDGDGVVEPPDEAATRELAEETGHEAASWRRLGTFWTAPGFSSEALTLYLARDLRLHDGSAGPDSDERLDLVRLPWREALERSVRGEISDAKSLVGIFWLGRLADRGDL